ncbi:hypothetical protein [His2 virus]|uniref:C2H2-type domain-containing protein n=1 Tax=His 2 virus TaxID=128710 RepID=Q25BE8_HIS2V|nr:hypothetical protein His2V_gp12 [His2 virus]AAQ13773.1 hypothetical protein [His2 virus]
MWQYELPCGHRSYRKRSSMDKHGNDAISRQNQDKRFVCRTCGKEYDYVIDLKTNREVKA